MVSGVEDIPVVEPWGHPTRGIPGGLVGGWGHPASRNCHRGSPGSFHSWQRAMRRAGCTVLGRWSKTVFWDFCSSGFIELDDGKIYRKALYLMVKTMVSCRFSLKPIQWWMFWGCCLEKYRNTGNVCLPSSGTVWFQSAEHWTLNQTFITIYHLPAYYAAAHKTQSK